MRRSVDLKSSEINVNFPFQKSFKYLEATMIKKSAVLLSGVVLFVAAAFAFSLQTNSVAPVSAAGSTAEMPDSVVYRHLFRHVAALKAKADDSERQGESAEHLRGFFKHKAKLNDEQARTLDEIAARCALGIEAIDERARPIIEAYKAQYPNGQVPHGQLPPPPPDELRQLTRERDELVLGKRDELRSAFGEEAFSRFQEFVKNKIAPNVSPVSARQ